MATVEATLITAEEFLALPDNGQPCELVKGRVVYMNPPGVRHGGVCVNTCYLVRSFLDIHDLGRLASNDSGVITERDPDTVRGADVAFYSYNRLPKDRPLPAGYADVSPEIVFEVLSPSESWKRALRKVAEYLEAGVLVVCVVSPEDRSVTLFYPDRDSVKLTGEQELTFPDILPGFSEPISRFWA